MPAGGRSIWTLSQKRQTLTGGSLFTLLCCTKLDTTGAVSAEVREKYLIKEFVWRGFSKEVTRPVAYENIDHASYNPAGTKIINLQVWHTTTRKHNLTYTSILVEFVKVYGIVRCISILHSIVKNFKSNCRQNIIIHVLYY